MDDDGSGQISSEERDLDVLSSLPAQRKETFRVQIVSHLETVETAFLIAETAVVHDNAVFAVARELYLKPGIDANARRVVVRSDLPPGAVQNTDDRVYCRTQPPRLHFKDQGLTQARIEHENILSGRCQKAVDHNRRRNFAGRWRRVLRLLLFFYFYFREIAHTEKNKVRDAILAAEAHRVEGHRRVPMQLDQERKFRFGFLGVVRRRKAGYCGGERCDQLRARHEVLAHESQCKSRASARSKRPEHLDERRRNRGIFHEGTKTQGRQQRHESDSVCASRHECPLLA